MAKKKININKALTKRVLRGIKEAPLPTDKTKILNRRLVKKTSRATIIVNTSEPLGKTKFDKSRFFKGEVENEDNLFLR